MEFPPTGGVIPTKAIVLMEIPKGHGFLILALVELVVLGMNLFSLRGEFTECFYGEVEASRDQPGHYLPPRILQYFSSGWNIADLTTYLLTLVFQLFRIYWYAVVLTMKLDVESDAYYGEFQGLAWISKTARLIICFAVILSWLKVSKFLHLIPSAGPMFTAALLTLRQLEVIVFLVLFMFITFIFAIGCHIAFGTALEDYSSFGESFVAVFVLFFGDWGA